MQQLELTQSMQADIVFDGIIFYLYLCKKKHYKCCLHLYMD